MAFHEEDLAIPIAQKNANENHNRKRKVLLSGWIDLCIRSLSDLILATYGVVWVVLNQSAIAMGNSARNVIKPKTALSKSKTGFWELQSSAVRCGAVTDAARRTSHSTKSRAL